MVFTTSWGGRSGARAIAGSLILVLGLCACQGKGRTEREVLPGEKIPLRAHLIDVSTYQIDASNEVTENVDEAVIKQRAMEILKQIFSDVSDRTRYREAQVDISVKIEVQRDGKTAHATATLRVNKAFTSEKIVELEKKAVYEGGKLKRFAAIRNEAALQACQNVSWALAGNKALLKHARSLRASGDGGGSEGER